MAGGNPARFSCLNPRDSDSDNDGFSDGDEVDRYLTSPCLRDTDGDGMSDHLEVVIHACLNELVADADLDLDNDGLLNRQELILGTSPCNNDSDGDGLPDAIDKCPGFASSNQSDLDGDGRGDVCDFDIDGDGCPNAYDRNPADVQNPDRGCLDRPVDTALTRYGRLITEFDERHNDPRWQLLIDGLRPNGPESCGPLSCPPQSVALIDPRGNLVRTILATERGFDSLSEFASSAQILPDLDADGVPDLAIAAPQAAGAENLPRAGHVVIVSGRTGSELGRLRGEKRDGRLGSSLALLSLTELAIGAPGAGEDPGAVHLLRLTDLLVVKSIPGSAAGDRFGATLVAGNLNGLNELVIGAPGDRGRGAVYGWNALTDLRHVDSGKADGDEFGKAIAWASSSWALQAPRECVAAGQAGCNEANLPWPELAR